MGKSYLESSGRGDYGREGWWEPKAVKIPYGVAVWRQN